MEVIESSGDKRGGGDCGGGRHKRPRVYWDFPMSNGRRTTPVIVVGSLGPGAVVGPLSGPSEAPKPDEVEGPPVCSSAVFDCSLVLTSGLTNVSESKSMESFVSLETLKPDRSPVGCGRSPLKTREPPDASESSKPKPMGVLVSLKAPMKSAVGPSERSDEFELMAVHGNVGLVGMLGCSGHAGSFEPLESLEIKVAEWPKISDKFKLMEMPKDVDRGESSEPEPTDLMESLEWMESPESPEAPKLENKELPNHSNELKLMEMPGNEAQGRSSEHEYIDLLKCLDQTESLESLEILKMDDVQLSNSLDEPTLSLMYNISEQVEFSNHEPIDFLKCSDSTEALESLETQADVAELSKNKDELKSMATPSNVAGQRSLHLIKETAGSDLCESSKALVKPLVAGSVAEATGASRHGWYPPRRRFSAVRDFPYGCGRDAPLLSRQEVEKIKGQVQVITASKSNMNGDKVGKAWTGRVHEGRLPSIPAKSHFMIEKASREVESSERKFSLMGVAPSQHKNKAIVRYKEGSLNRMAKAASLHKNKTSISYLGGSLNVTGRVAPLHNSKALVKYEGKARHHHNNKAVVRWEEDRLNLMDKSTPQLKNKSIIRYEEGSSRKSGEHEKCFVGQYANEQTLTRKNVRETLRLFQLICRKFMHKCKRVDMKAFTLLKQKGMTSSQHYLGSVPGIEVGDEFHYRVELCVAGLHRRTMAGIDFMHLNGRKVATCIVSSGDYNDIMDSTDVLVYSGEGGNPRFQKGRKGPPADQKLERGNLALNNSMCAQTPVRVIHGFKEPKTGDSLDASAKRVVKYVYDGLYLVEKCWTEMGPKGFNIFKFRMRRMPGQPELALKEVRMSRGMIVRHGICVDDISKGKEKRAIGAVNIIDGEPPVPFTYTTRIRYPSWYKPSLPRGCDCIGGCINPSKCACAAKNGGEFPFNCDGAIVHAKPLVYECGPSCRCPPSCYNRVSQHGVKLQLEIFKTKSRGWGVRSLSSIPSGSFICEYTGELLDERDAEKRTNDEYLFDIGKNYYDESLWGGLSSLIPGLEKSASPEGMEDTGFTVDAARYGSVGRFINHSCSPNLYAQNLLYDHDNKSMPHIMLFAAENIPPLKELTYHYNYTIGQVYDSDGNLKIKKCYCGSAECTGRLY